MAQSGIPIGIAHPNRAPENTPASRSTRLNKLKQFFEKNFTPFISLSKSSLATGYYEPTLQGSLEKTEEF